MNHLEFDRRTLLQAAVATSGLAAASGVNDAVAQQPTTLVDEDSIEFRGKTTGLMEGFPPKPEKRVNIHNYTSSIAKTRWALQNPEIVFRTVEIKRGQAPARPFPRAMLARENVNSIRIPWRKSPDETAEISFSDWLSRSNTDALIVVHKGRIAVEIYVGDMRPDTRHVFFSAGKSLLAATAATFMKNGELTEGTKVDEIVPELKKTGLAGATVRHLLDQTSGVDFKEFPAPNDNETLVDELTFGTARYRKSKMQMPAYSRVAGILPFLQDERQDIGLYDFLFQQTERSRNHGDALWYAEPHVMALQLVLERVAQRSFVDLFSERIWAKLAPEYSGRAIVDCVGTASNGTGLCFTLRDTARFGQMLLDGGAVGARQVIPQGFIQDILKNPNSASVNPKSNMWGATAEGTGYRSLFWTRPIEAGETPTMDGIGLYSQHIFVDPLRNLVIVKFSTLPSLPDITTDYLAICSLSRSIAKL